MASSRSFFYYGMMPLDDEVHDDVLMTISQPRRSLFYARNKGSGVPEFENAPTSASVVTMLKYEVANALAERNLSVTDGTHTANVYFAGNYTGASFKLSMDGHGGTNVSFV